MGRGFAFDPENSNSLRRSSGKPLKKAQSKLLFQGMVIVCWGLFHRETRFEGQFLISRAHELNDVYNDLLRFVDTHSASKSELDEVQQLLSRLDQTYMLQSTGYAKFHDAFCAMQREPAFRNMVASISCDKAVWEAIQYNKAVQGLQGSIVAAKDRLLNHSEEQDIIALILRWILNVTTSKVLELAESFGLLVNEMIQSSPKDKPISELDHLLEEKVQSSLLLSIVIMLIVVITRG